MEEAIYAISDFVFSLNATAVAVSLLDFYTNAEVNGSLLLSPDCAYNVTFAGDEATAYLGRPWLALPTVATAVTVGGDHGNASGSYSVNSTTTPVVSATLTPWLAGGVRQSFGRQGGTTICLGHMGPSSGMIFPRDIRAHESWGGGSIPIVAKNG